MLDPKIKIDWKWKDAKNIFYANSNLTSAGVVILISGKKKNCYIKAIEDCGHYILMKRSIH